MGVTTHYQKLKGKKEEGEGAVQLLRARHL